MGKTWHPSMHRSTLGIGRSTAVFIAGVPGRDIRRLSALVFGAVVSADLNNINIH